MGPFDTRARLSARLSELETDQQLLRSAMRLMQQEWADVLARVSKAYKRVERANQRAVERDGGVTPTPEALPALETASDPFSRKWRQVQEQTGAVQQRTDPGAG